MRQPVPRMVGRQLAESEKSLRVMATANTTESGTGIVSENANGNRLLGNETVIGNGAKIMTEIIADIITVMMTMTVDGLPANTRELIGTRKTENVTDIGRDTKGMRRTTVDGIETETVIGKEARGQTMVPTIATYPRGRRREMKVHQKRNRERNVMLLRIGFLMIAQKRFASISITAGSF